MSFCDESSSLTDAKYFHWAFLGWDHQGARGQGKQRSLPVLWSSGYFATSFSSVLSNSPFHLSTQKPSRQDHSSVLITVRQTMKSLLSSVSWLWALVEFWRMPARSAQRYKPCSATDSAFLCLHLTPEPCCSLGSHRFVPTPSKIKIWVCSGWRCSKHSRGRTRAPFLSTAKWHKLLLHETDYFSCQSLRLKLDSHLEVKFIFSSCHIWDSPVNHNSMHGKLPAYVCAPWDTSTSLRV